MNREIKFRAWDGEKMHEGVSPWRWDFVISNSWHRCEKSTGDGFLGSGGNTAEMLVPAIRFKEVMQFTGLKDKNGKEIYEGDVVVTPKGICAVTYELGCFYTITESRYRLGGWDGVVEIIGNIHENPELLTN